MSRTPLFDSLRRALRLAALVRPRRAAAAAARRADRDGATRAAGSCATRPPPRPPRWRPAAAARRADAAPPPAGAAPARLRGAGRAAHRHRRRRHGRAQHRLQAAEGRAHAPRSSKAPTAPAAACSRPRTCWATGLTTELGGEFIDTHHEEMLTLMTEFGLERLDTAGPGAASLKPETYFINGRHYTQAQAAARSCRSPRRSPRTTTRSATSSTTRPKAAARRFDRMSIAEYLDSIGVTGWMRELLDGAYVTEYGLDAGEQSALNFVFLIGTGDLEDTDAFDCSARATSGTRCAAATSGSSTSWPSASSRRFAAASARGDPQQGRGLHADVPDRRQGRRRGRRHRRADDSVHAPARGEDGGRSAGAQDARRSRSSATAPTRRCWSDSRAGRGRSWATAARPTATRRSSSRGPTASCRPGAAGGLTLYSGGKLAHDAGQGTAEEAAARLMRGHRARVSRDAARAQRQGVALPLADASRGRRALLLLQTRPVDDDRRLGRAAGRQSVLRRRALQLRLPGLHERRGAVGRRHGQGRHGEGERLKAGPARLAPRARATA